MRIIFYLMVFLTLSSCGAEAKRYSGSYKVGNPYEINGVWYHPHVNEEYEEIGVASWYGPGFHRKKTANGEVFDKYAMTAAHPTLPLPSIVRVTNVANGESVKLRVNDRGPFAKGRIIDVSKKAAKTLGFIDEGTAQVRVEFLRDDTERLHRQLFGQVMF